jgi:two-component system response regulator QseB
MPGLSNSLPRLLYVEDDATIATIAVEVLGEAYDVTHALTGEEGLALALAHRFDVMVIDWRLAEMSGMDLIRAVRTASIETPVLMLTALGSIDDRVEGLDGGADDYLVKPFDFAELLARLRALRRGSRGASDRRELGDWVFAPRAQAVFSPFGDRVALTGTETELLELLTSSPDHVFSREEIIDSVFHGGASTTVETYVHYIRRKTTPDIIETVRARGYRSGQPR